MRRPLLCLILLLTPIAAAGNAAAGSRGGGPTPAGSAAAARSDFNGDGISDLAIGALGEQLDPHDEAGVVHVLFGAAAGLTGASNELWHQNTTSDGFPIQNSVEPEDHFGNAVVTGDFDRNGYADLVVGVSDESNGSDEEVGAVHIIYGTADSAGLGGEGNQFLWQNGTLDGIQIKGTAEAEDNFGDRLAVGNFGKGSTDDLAIGTPGDNIDGKDDAGSVHVFYGTRGGLTAEGHQVWHQNSKMNGVGIKDKSQEFDDFGESLTAGDFGKSERDDLVIGVPDESAVGAGGAGLVHVIYGRKNGLAAKGNEVWHQDSKKAGVSIKEVRDSSDSFGEVATAGDFGKSGRDDLAVSVTGEIVGGQDTAGAVNVIYGAKKGLTAKGNQLWHQNSSPGGVDIADEAETNDRFGWELAGANVGMGGRDDLVIGSQESLGVIDYAGGFHVIYGTPSGLSATGNQFWTQDVGAVEDTAEASDYFSGEIGWGYYNDDGFADLAVSSTGEDVSGMSSAGAVNVLFGTAGGLDDNGDQFWHQDSNDGVAIQGVAEISDFFGSGLPGEH